jgi:hypothetical protein
MQSILVENKNIVRLLFVHYDLNLTSTVILLLVAVIILPPSISLLAFSLPTSNEN